MSRALEIAAERAPGLAGLASRRHNLGVVDLVLASASPRRADLLRSAGLRIEIRPVDCDETPRPDETAVDYARRIAEAKLLAAVSMLEPSSTILVADTVVWREADPKPLGKPRDRVRAAAMLRSLFGGTHRVTTAWALARPGSPSTFAHETTMLWMRTPADATLDAYLETDEWRDKAGGYGIQGSAAGWVTRIEGSYTNVVGLPLAQVLQALASTAEAS